MGKRNYNMQVKFLDFLQDLTSKNVSNSKELGGHVALNLCPIFSQILRAFKAPMQRLSPGLGDWVIRDHLQVSARAVNARHGIQHGHLAIWARRQGAHGWMAL